MPESEPHDLIRELDEEERKLKRARRSEVTRKRLVKQRFAKGETLTYMQRAASNRENKRRALEKAQEVERRRQGKVEQMRRCIELYSQGMPKARIAAELGKSANTIGFWLKDVPKPELQEAPDPMQQALELEAGKAVADDFLRARDEEEEALIENAKAQNTPADQYQAYVAAQAIRLLRDSFKLVRGPRTVRELSELDQLIRRNLGLNAKGGGAGGGLQIDISILNNTKATPRTGVVVTVDAEEADS